MHTILDSVNVICSGGHRHTTNLQAGVLVSSMLLDDLVYVSYKQPIAPSLLTVKQCQKMTGTDQSPDLLALFECESNRFVRWFCTTIAVGSYQPSALHTPHQEIIITKYSNLHVPSTAIS